VLALLFPGQGSQEVGMGRDVYTASEAARSVYEAADAALGLPLSRLCFEGPEEELLRTEIQQPAILATGIALLRALEERTPLAPAYNAGHSLGEYTALVASGSLSLDDAVRIVHARGRFMQEAVPAGRGAMAAVLGASTADVSRACERARAETGRIVALANFNAPRQTVISGDALAVEMACSRARQRGARRTIPLPVSAPFHSPLMRPAAEKLALELEGVRFRDPRPPVMCNVEAEPVDRGARFAELLTQQVTAPVRFTDMISGMRELGVTGFLEVGPGRVLTGLVGRIAADARRESLGRADDLERAARFALAEAG
jgi:[acyl-carrier-protein] S-malonyltransferase